MSRARASPRAADHRSAQRRRARTPASRCSARGSIPTLRAPDPRRRDRSPTRATTWTLRAPDLPVERVEGLGHAPRPAQRRAGLRQVVQVIREFRPHIVHTHKAKAGVLGRLAAWGTGTRDGPHVPRSSPARVLLAVEDACGGRGRACSSRAARPARGGGLARSGTNCSPPRSAGRSSARWSRPGSTLPDTRPTRATARRASGSPPTVRSSASWPAHEGEAAGAVHRHGDRWSPRSITPTRSSWSRAKASSSTSSTSRPARSVTAWCSSDGGATWRRVYARVRHRGAHVGQRGNAGLAHRSRRARAPGHHDTRRQRAGSRGRRRHRFRHRRRCRRGRGGYARRLLDDAQLRTTMGEAALPAHRSRNSPRRDSSPTSPTSTCASHRRQPGPAPGRSLTIQVACAGGPGTSDGRSCQSHKPSARSLLGTGTTGQQIFHHNVWFRERSQQRALPGAPPASAPGRPVHDALRG